MSIPRWICPGCQSNNMPESATCFRCGMFQPIAPPLAAPPPYAPPPAASPPPLYSPAPQPVQAQKGGGLPHAAWVVLGLIIIGTLVTTLFSVVSTATGYARGWYRPEAVAPPPQNDTRYRVHQADLRGTDPATGRQSIRCTTCKGRRQALQYDPNLNTERYSTCTVCNGAGQIAPLEGVIVVPDTDPSAYD